MVRKPERLKLNDAFPEKSLTRFIVAKMPRLAAFLGFTTTAACRLLVKLKNPDYVHHTWRVAVAEPTYLTAKCDLCNSVAMFMRTTAALKDESLVVGSLLPASGLALTPEDCNTATVRFIMES